MLARAVGPRVERDIREILEHMFNAGLTQELTSALKIVALEIPGLQREIQGQYVYVNEGGREGGNCL